MRQRTITAIFFTLAMLGGIYGGRETFFALFALVAAGCGWELGNLVLTKEKRTTLRKVIGCFMALLPVCWAGCMVLFSAFCGHSTPSEIADGHWEAHLRAANMLLLSLIVLTPILFALELFTAGKHPFQHIGYYLTAMCYIGLPIALLFSIATPDAAYSPHRVLGLLLLVWTNDTGAFLFGRKWGKRKLFERISPKKTWEGSIGGAVFALLAAWALSCLIPDFTLKQWLALSVVAAIGSNLGDLVESMLKRSVGVKDSGTLLPGHGGLLDRFDAFIFCLPFYWLILQ